MDAQPGSSPFVTPIEGLILLRSTSAKPPSHLIFKPSLCVTLQGTKRSTFGDRRFEYGAGQALVVGVEMPAISTVIEASRDKPYLGIILELDFEVMRDVFQSLRIPSTEPTDAHKFGVLLTDFESALADCVLRFLRLLDTPGAIPMLAPLIMREICYWLLSGPNGSDIANFVLGAARTRRIIEAIHALRDRFWEAIRVDRLASIARMSPSAFHREFKALTSMTPIQYQKHLRLLQARQLMVAGEANAEMAAHQVGYESSSQFSREYTRMFGSPPRRDIAALRSDTA